MKGKFWVVSTAALLAACSGGSDGPTTAGCLATLTGGGTQIDGDVSACPDCSFEDGAFAIDDSAASFARLELGAGGGAAAVRATAQAGVVYPAGQYAGVVAYFPKSSTPNANVNIAVRTYLGGVLQEQVSSSTSVIGNVDGAGEDTRYGGLTGSAFDAVEALVTVNGLPQTVRFYDFCADR